LSNNQKDIIIFSDEELVTKARKGDHEAFREIVKRYEPLVAKTVIGMLGNCQEAEDTGQETFVSFYKNLKNFRGDSGVGTYLTRIAINLSLNELKRRQKRIWRFPAITEKEETTIAAEGNSEKKEKIEIVQRAVRKLEPKFRSVLVLRLISGYSPEETSEILKIPVGTVFSRLARAQKKLEVILKPYMGEL